MKTRIRTIATVLTAAAALPATAVAAERLDLRGAATLRQTDPSTAVLRFALDEQITGASKGTAQLGALDRATIRPDGHHGDDPMYSATFHTDADDLEVGTRYAVRITAHGRAPRTVRLKLIDQR